MTYDIIIPHYGVTEELTSKCLRCLESIREHSVGADYRILFFDNATPLRFVEPIQKALRVHNHLYIFSTENLGFIKAVNMALTLSDAPYVVLMNNDTEAATHWLSKLRAPLDSHSKIGLCGPRTTTPNSWQGRVPNEVGWRVLDTSAMLAFFCTMFKRQVFEELGGLDEDFGVGFGDDDMYCLRAHRAGWRLALASDLVIPHHHRSTFHTVYGVEETRHMQEKALSLFHEKRRAAQ